MQRRQRRVCRRARDQVHHRFRIPGQPPVGGLFQLGDRIVHRDTGLRDDLAHFARGVVAELLEQGPHGARRQQAQRVQRDGAFGARAAGIQRQGGQAVEHAGALRQRQQAPGGPDRRHSHDGIVGAHRLEDRLDGAWIGNGFQRQQQRRLDGGDRGGGEMFENLAHGPRADDGQPCDGGVAPHGVVAFEIADQAADFKTGRGPDCHGYESRGFLRPKIHAITMLIA